MTEVERAANKPLVLISGDEPTLRDFALEELLRAAEVTKDDFETELLDGDTSGPADWSASAGTAPFMAARRTVIVRHVLRRDPDAKSTPLANLPPTALVVLVADDTGGDESRLATRKKNWEKWTAANGGAVLSPSASGAQAANELRVIAGKYDKKLSGPALDTLLEMCGGGFSRAAEELQKLCLYVGDAPQISEADVRAIVVPAQEWNVFSMMDGLIKNDVASALRQLKVLIANGDKADAAIFGSIMPQTLRMLRLLYQARICVEARIDPARAPDTFADRFPAKPNICREKPFVQRQYMGAAQKVSLKKLARCYEVLADTDARLKGAVAAFSRTETMELMLLQMSAILHPTPSVRR